MAGFFLTVAIYCGKKVLSREPFLFLDLAVGYLMELQTLWDTEARSKIIKGVATIDLSTL